MLVESTRIGGTFAILRVDNCNRLTLNDMRTAIFSGTATALITPFDRHGAVDYASLSKLVEFQIAAGIDALVPCGSTGESATLSQEEKIAVIRFVVETVRGRVPVVAGTGCNETSVTCELTKQAAEAGADGALIVTPYYNRPTPLGIQRHFEAIAETTDIPLLMYNVPSRAALNMSAETQLHIAETVPSIVGTKEASGDLLQVQEIARHMPAGFSLLSGEDSITLPIIAAGGTGVIAVIANYVPEQFGKAVNKALKGDVTGSRADMFALMELMKLNFCETSPQPVKAIMSWLGHCENVLRLPLVPLSKEHVQPLQDALKRYGVTLPC